LVQLLDDEREGVRASTRETIRQRVDLWLRERRADHEQALVLLMHEMAQQPLPRDEPERAFLKQTALKLITWPLEEASPEAAQLVLDCTSVLGRLTRRPLPEVVQTASREELVPLSGRVYEQVLPPAALSAPAPVVTDESVLPSTPPMVVPDEPSESGSASRNAAPGVLPRDDTETRLPPERFYADDPQRLGSGSRAPSSLGPGASAVAAEPAKTSASTVDLQALQELPNRSLIRHLHGLPEVAAHAERLLRQRGYSANSLVLARQLDDPDPAVRRSLVDALPQAEQLDAAAWLFELSGDPAEEVRSAARAMLATSRNPFTKRRLEFSQPR
jgi:hypothetical protein